MARLNYYSHNNNVKSSFNPIVFIINTTIWKNREWIMPPSHCKSTIQGMIYANILLTLILKLALHKK